MGITLTRLNEGLEEIGLTKTDIDAVLFTHDHTDHISGARFFSPKIIYSLSGTLSSLTNVVELYKPFKIKDLTITPIPTSHDATNPCGYVIEDDKDKLTYITDTGMFLSDTLKVCFNPTYLIIECNHDISMLLKTNRPYELKNRILSEHGHLCNEDSAYASISIIGDKTKDIVLAHISEEANTPEVALSAYEKIFARVGINTSKYNLRCANQWKSLSGGENED